ncbi:hypothetical protein B296_00046858 [Ensete ventricosum]|uniref:Uncharacterized protein n=1 Tax=Ensete ventricosum TaxID=4639 RepID=A0A426WZH0_ENSVE|nr:hypothetical protein B296_00046858 [Ensete ventricosum]
MAAISITRHQGERLNYETRRTRATPRPVKSIHRVDTIANSPGVHRKLTEGIESLLGWHNGVYQKKTETRRKIVGGSRKACRDSDDAMGSRRKFARRFAEGIGKLTGNVKGDCREEDRRTCHKIARGCRSM